MNLETYLEDMTTQLQHRGVSEERIAQVVGEIESQFAESGESPVDAFGPAARYAEEVAVSSEQRVAKSAAEKWHKRTFTASALDEMETLETVGKEGWELMNVGLLALFCRRPEDMSQAYGWEYKRRTGVNRAHIKQEMARDEWEPCGVWVVFHYFKRRLGSLASGSA